jgi:plasmid stabilization system protein ParE
MPATSVEFHPGAEEDADGAHKWYTERSLIAARAFLTELTASVEKVAEAPERWPAYLSGTRRYLFPNFPFSLVYRVRVEAVIVVAVAHHRRRPGYWRERP